MTAAQSSSVSLIKISTRLATIAAAGLMLGACANGSLPDLGLSAPTTNVSQAAPSGDDMGKAINYWGRKYAKSPTDKEAALNYAKNLKASGNSKQAFRVLQQASTIHGNDREIASEYGRLALSQGQIELGNKLLALADDPSAPDWRIVSGRGAALAKLGKYGEAVTMFERAHKLAPSNPSVVNNLAMAHAGNGNLKRAEFLLRGAVQNPMARDKVTKNLALVLRLQGRNSEATAIGNGGAVSNIATASTARPAPKAIPVKKVRRKVRQVRKVSKVRKVIAKAPKRPQIAIRQSVQPTSLTAPVSQVVRSTLR